MAEKITVTSSSGDCIAAIRTAIPRITNETLEIIKDRIEVELKYSTKLEQDAVADAIKEVSAEMRAGIKSQRFQEFMNITARKKVRSFIDQNFSDDPFLGLRARMMGTSVGRKGSRLSANLMQEDLREQYQGGLVTELIQADVFDITSKASREFDEKIYIELQRIDEPAALKDTGDAQAKKAAEIINRWTEKARIEANKSGANIGKLSMYVVRQSHNAEKIRALGRAGWKDLIRDRLDWERIEKSGGKLINDREEWLNNIHEGIVTGTHMRDSTNLPSFDAKASVAKRLSHERVFHFKAGDWYEYNVKAGEGNVIGATMLGLERSAMATGLMKAFGPSALHNMDSIRNDLLKKYGDTDVRKRLDDFSYNTLQLSLTGELGIPVNNMTAVVGQTIRTFENFKLGGSAVTALFGDAMTLASEIKFEGGRLLGGYKVSIDSLFQAVGKPERVEQARALGLMANGWLTHFSNRIDAEGNMTPTLSKVNAIWFKANFLTPLTDRRKIATGIYMSSIAASRSKVPFDSLSDDYKNVLNFFDIGDNEWTLLRTHAIEEVAGEKLMTLEGIDNIPDAEIKRIHGGEVSKFRIDELRDELKTKFHSMLVDRVDTAVLKPDKTTAALQTMGTRAGTIPGELMRVDTQFKGFPLLFIQKVLNREIHGRQGASKANRIMRLSSILVQGTMMGYLTIYTKSIISGKEPPSLDDPETLRRSAQIGGGAGFYGDILFGELRDRFGSSPVTALLGPGAGTAGTVLELIGRARDGDLTAIDTINKIYRESGVTSLFYFKAALDYGILYQTIDYIDPNYIPRMERRANKEGRKFIISPTDAVK